MKESNIGYTDFSAGDANFVTGCTPCSEGCTNCYARRIYKRWGLDFTVRTHPDKLARLARATFPEYSPKRGRPYKPMVFPVDTGDIFHEQVPVDFILSAFSIMSARRDVDWQILTKRPKRMNAVLFGEEGGYYLGGGDFYGNIRLMVSVENQKRADERIPELLRHWEGPNGVSYEPALGPVDFGCWLEYDASVGTEPELDQIIVGAESGPNRRPFDMQWARDVRDQCKKAGVAFFGKQDSGLYPGKPLLIDGKEIKEWPR